jgi:hypothetical protein
MAFTRMIVNCQKYASYWIISLSVVLFQRMLVNDNDIKKTLREPHCTVGTLEHEKRAPQRGLAPGTLPLYSNRMAR